MGIAALIIIVIIVFLLAYFFSDIIKYIRGWKSKLKADIVKSYGISKVTFNKWLEILHPQIGIELAGKRKYNQLDLFWIYMCLGIPSNSNDVVSKFDLHNTLAIDFKTLKNRVLSNQDDIGINEYQYGMLNFFPPNVIERIINA